jgi:hypothetical protein
MTGRIFLALSGVFLLAMGFSSFVRAQAPAGAKEAPPAQAGGGEGEQQDPAVSVERGARGKKIYRITTEIRIEGKVQKPEAFYILQKSSINYRWTEL